jgi:hypothetical protein
MADDEFYDAFEINDADLDYALNPGQHRRRQTKDQAIYGKYAGSFNNIHAFQECGQTTTITTLGFLLAEIVLQ